MDNKYPEWLFNIMQNDYGEEDGYWYDIKTNDGEFKEAYLKLHSLKRKYSDYSQWQNACQVYDDYIGVIIDYNGGEFAVKSLMESGFLPEGWVPRPKLKGKKNNKALQEADIVLSSYQGIDTEDTVEMSVNVNPMSSTANIEDDFRRPKGYTKRAIQEALDEARSKKRVQNMRKNMMSYDVLSLYYQNDNMAEDDDTESSIESAYDRAIEESFENSRLWEPTSQECGGARIMHNQVVRYRDQESIRIAEEIYQESGLRAFNIETMPREKQRLYRSKFGITMDSKAERKAAKKQKKYLKELDKKHAADELSLARAMTRNRGAIDLSGESFTMSDFRKKFK